MPCVIDINVTDPSGVGINLSPGGIGGFGGFSLPNILNIPTLFPEDLTELFKIFSLVTPVGAMKAPLDLNYDKSIFSTVMKLLNNLFPFLMLYKLLMPAFELILCIIEVLCAIANPFKLIRAIKRLFSRCLPAFLSLFPPFALIIMIISLILALLDVIVWIVEQIVLIASLFIKNLLVIYNAVAVHTEQSILAGIRKVAQNICMFKNIFIILDVFMTFFDLIKSMISLPFSIPPCDSENGSVDGCCTPDVCPAIVKNGNFVRLTGKLQYLNTVKSYLGGFPPEFAQIFSLINTNVRESSYQFYDLTSTEAQQFINITDPFDVTENPKQVLFPADANYTKDTPIKQIPYLVDMKFLYNPAQFGRDGYEQLVEFKDCYVIKAPTRSLTAYDGSSSTVNTGVMSIVGGKGYDGYGNVLYGYDSTGLVLTGEQATLENFIFIQDKYGENVTVSPTDTVSIEGVEYTFKPVHEVLFSKSLITLGCIPEVALERDIVNSQFAANMALNLSQLNALFNSGNDGAIPLIDPDDNTVIKFPNPESAKTCLEVSLTNLTQSFNEIGIANFQASATVCMNTLKNDCIKSLNELIKIAANNNKSTFSLTPATQFTTRTIQVAVDLKESNGTSIAERLPAETGVSLAKKIVPNINFGSITQFAYDGAKYFTAELSSKDSGKGKISVIFDGNYLSTFTVAPSTNDNSSVAITELDYEFIYSPDLIDLGAGDTDGRPRRDESDVARNSEGNE